MGSGPGGAIAMAARVHTVATEAVSRTENARVVHLESCDILSTCTPVYDGKDEDGDQYG